MAKKTPTKTSVKAKELFDSSGLEEAKKNLGGETRIYLAEVKVSPPGMLHNSAAGLIETLDAQSKPSKAKKKGDFKWENSSYFDKDKCVCHPAWHLRSSIVKAAKSFQIPGKGKKTYHDKARAYLFVEPEYIPVRLKGKKVTKPSSIHECIGKTKDGRPKPTRRPRFNPGHTLRFLVYANHDGVPGIVARDCLILAGREFGIGDYRPEFGKFEVVSFAQIDPDDAMAVLKDIQSG